MKLYCRFNLKFPVTRFIYSRYDFSRIKRADSILLHERERPRRGSELDLWFPLADIISRIFEARQCRRLV